MADRNAAEMKQIHQSLARMIARGATVAVQLGLPEVATILREAELAAIRAAAEVSDLVSAPWQAAMR